MTDTIRETAVKALVSKLQEMNGSGTYATAWDAVLREDLGRRLKRAKALIGVYDTEERKQVLTFPCVECVLRVVLEFGYKVDDGDDPSEKVNAVLGEIERKLFEDITLGGAVRLLRETGSEKDIDGPLDRVVRGAVFLELVYHHHHNDPRRPDRAPPIGG